MFRYMALLAGIDLEAKEVSVLFDSGVGTGGCYTQARISFENNVWQPRIVPIETVSVSLGRSSSDDHFSRRFDLFLKRLFLVTAFSQALVTRLK